MTPIDTLQDRNPRTPSRVSSMLALLVIAAVLLGVYFRFAHLGRRVYRYDEAQTSLWVSGHSSSDLARELTTNRPIAISDLAKYRHIDTTLDLRRLMGNLASTQPHQGPLFAVLAWSWARTVGDSPGRLRALSALLSLLAVPAMYWLARELFERRSTAWVAVALLALSPIHVLYAQDARAYSLWTAAVLLSSAILLRAMRTMTGAIWAAYALSIAVGMATHLLMLWVAVAHGVYVLACAGFRATRTVRAYVLATLIAALSFTPWIINFALRRHEAVVNTHWLRQPVTFLAWLKTAALNFACTIFDARMRDDNALYYLIVPVLLVLGWAWWFLLRTTPKRTWLFLSVLAATVGLALAIPDLAFGGYGFAVARYTIPCYLSLQLALAEWLAAHLDGPQHRAWYALLIGILSLGALSSIVFVRADTWWTKTFNQYNREIAQILRAADHPLVISDWPAAILTLSYTIDDGATVLIVPPNETPLIPTEFTSIFVFSPMQPELGRSLDDLHWRRERAHERGSLWRLVRRGNGHN